MDETLVNLQFTIDFHHKLIYFNNYIFLYIYYSDWLYNVKYKL